MSVIRCIKEPEFRKLQNSEFITEKIRVYYGFDNYRNDVAFIEDIVSVIRREHPEISLRDMLIHYVDMHESIQHSDFTMIQVMVSANYVQKNLNNYIIL